MFERIGKFCFSQNRSVLFFCCLTIPIFSAAFYSFIQHQKAKHLEELFSISCKKGKIALERKLKKEQFIKRYTNSNPYFLDEYIESLTFLKSEIDELRNLIQHPALCDKKPFELRLDYLCKGTNRLSFIDEAIRSTNSIKETEEKQRAPDQMSGDDLKKLLAVLEDIPIEKEGLLAGNRPQILITDFRIESKQTPIKTNVYEVEMQFLKREFE